MVDKINFRLYRFIDHYDGQKKVVIFGTGVFGQVIFSILHDAGISVSYFASNTTARNETFYCDTPVRLPELIDKKDTYFIIAVTNATEKQNIMYQLLEMGVEREQLIIPLDVRGAQFQDLRLKTIPEFSEAVKEIQLEKIVSDKRYFCDYFLKNDISRIAVYGHDPSPDVVSALLSGSGVALEEIDPERRIIPEADAILVLDDENFYCVEEEFMDKSELPVINFWRVSR